MYIYIYICMYVYIYIYIHIYLLYTNQPRAPPGRRRSDAPRVEAPRDKPESARSATRGPGLSDSEPRADPAFTNCNFRKQLLN